MSFILVCSTMALIAIGSLIFFYFYERKAARLQDEQNRQDQRKHAASLKRYNSMYSSTTGTPVEYSNGRMNIVEK